MMPNDKYFSSLEDGDKFIEWPIGGNEAALLVKTGPDTAVYLATGVKRTRIESTQEVLRIIT